MQRTGLIALVILFAAQPVSVAAVPVPERVPPVEPVETPQHAAGRCLLYLIERAQLQATRSDKLEPMLARGSALDSALAVLSLPAPRPGTAGELSAKASALSEQIEDLMRVLDGRSTDAGLSEHDPALREQVIALQASMARQELLAQAHAAEGKRRVAMLDRLHLEKQALAERMDTVGTSYQERLGWLRKRVDRHRGAFEEAMRGYARLAKIEETSIQAVRVHATITEGRLSFSWTDARGSVVASAHLWMRVRPDTQTDPPLVLGRYPVLLQNRQEAQISAGYFLIDFRVGVDELNGEARVLECATRLLDIDGLGRLIPRLGSNGLN